MFAELAQFIAGLFAFRRPNMLAATVFCSFGAFNVLFHAGDVGYIPRSFGHYIENTGKSDLVFLEVFNSSYYSSISFAQWLSHLPPELVKDHFNFADQTLASLPKNKTDVV